MSNNYDIEMRLDDTLELDAIIQDWSNPSDIIKESTADDDYNLKGIQTKTGIFNPKGAGEYKFNINGQSLLIKVTDPDNILNTLIDNFEDIIYNDKGNTLSDYYSEDLSAASIVTSNPKEGSRFLSMNTGSKQNTIVSMPSDGLPNYPSAGDTFKYWLTVDSECRNQVYYGRQERSGGRSNGDGYMIVVTNNGFYLRKDGRNGTDIDKVTSLNISSNTYYKCEVQWGSSGSHNIYLYDNNDTQVASLSGSDSTYTSGGISFTADNGSSSGTNKWDNMKII